MIRLSKTPQPKILAENAKRWTKELIDAGEDATKTQKTRYNHAEIKDALKKETHGKCAYCESKPLHVAPGDIEHIIPKSPEPERTFEWGNLTLACDICNTNKGSKRDLLDPYSREPGEHIFFLGAMLCSKDALGRHTEIILDLNRKELLAKRQERIANLNKNLREIIATSDNDIKKILINRMLKEYLSTAEEYSACMRDAIQKLRDAKVIN